VPNEGNYDIRIRVGLVNEIAKTREGVLRSIRGLQTDVNSEAKGLSAPIKLDREKFDLGLSKRKALNVTSYAQGVRGLATAFGKIRGSMAGGLKNSLEDITEVLRRAGMGFARVTEQVNKNTAALNKNRATQKKEEQGLSDLAREMGWSERKLRQFGVTAEQVNRYVAGLNRQLQQTKLLSAQGIVGPRFVKSQQSIGSAARRVLLWSTAAFAMYRGIAAIRQAIQVTVDLENEMIQLQKVMQRGVDFGKLEEDLFAIANTFGYAISDTIKIARTWAQQGYEINDVLSLTNTTLSAMASLNIEAAEATDYLTSAMRVWGVEVEDLQKNLSSLMAVQAQFAIDSADLAMVLGKIGAGAKAAGDDMSFLAGAATAIREATRKTASQVTTILKATYGRAFKTTALRTLRDVGVATNISADQFRDFGSILSDLSTKWSTLTDIQRRSVAQALGGLRYWSDIMALMGNFDRAVEAQKTFLGAWGESGRAAEQQIESLKNQFASLTNTMIELGREWGINVIAPFSENIAVPGLKAIADSLKAINAVAGKSGTAVGGMVLFGATISRLFGRFPAFKAAIAKLGVTQEAYNATANRTANVLGRNSRQFRVLTAASRRGHLGMVKLNAVTRLFYGSMGRATGVLGRFIVRLKATGIAAGLVLKSMLKWSLIIGTIELIYQGLAKVFGWFEDTEEQIGLTGEALERYRDFAKQVGSETIAPSSTIKNLEALAGAIRGAQDEAGRMPITFSRVSELIDTLDEQVANDLRESYKNLNTELETQHQLWEDLIQVGALYKELVLKDSLEEYKKMTDEVGKQAKELGEAYALLSGISSRASNQDILNMWGRLSTEDTKRAVYALERIFALKGETPLDDKEVDIVYDSDKKTTRYNLLAAGVDRLRKALDGFDPQTIGKLLVKDIIPKYDLSVVPVLDFEGMDKQANIDNTSKTIFDIFTAAMDQAAKYSPTLGIVNLIDSLKRPGSDRADFDLIDPVYKSADIAIQKLRELHAELKTIRETRALPNNILNVDLLGQQIKEYEKSIGTLIASRNKMTAELKGLLDQRNELVSELMNPSKGYFGAALISQNPMGAFGHMLKLIKDYNYIIGLTSESSAFNDAQKEQAQQLVKIIQKIHELQRNIGSLNDTDLSPFIKDLEDLYAELGRSPKTWSVDFATEVQTAVRDAMVAAGKEQLANEGKIKSAILEGEFKILEAQRGRYAEAISLQREQWVAEKKLKLQQLTHERDHQLALLKIQAKAEKDKLAITYFNELFNPKFLIELAEISAKYGAMQEKLERVYEVNKGNINVLSDQEYYLARINDYYGLQNDLAQSLESRTENIRNIVSGFLTDWNSLSGEPLKGLRDVGFRLGEEFQKAYTKAFTNNVIKRSLVDKLFPDYDEQKTKERLIIMSEVIKRAHIAGLQIGFAGLTGNYVGMVKAMQSASLTPEDIRKIQDSVAAEVGSINTLTSSIATLLPAVSSVLGGALGGGAKGAAAGQGATTGMLLAQIFASSSPYAMIAGGVLGAIGGLFTAGGDENEDAKYQEVTVEKLDLIEQHTAKLANLTESMVNISRNVYIPAGGGFVLNGNINVTGGGDPQVTAKAVINEIDKRYNRGSRGSGSRGLVLS